MTWQDECLSWRARITASRNEDVFNDAEFVIEGVTEKANRAIMAMASPVMMAQFYGPLAAKIGIPIAINDEMGTSRGFRAMIDFIYDEEKYSINDLLDGKEEITESGQLEKVMELLFFGDKYQVKSLICFCRNILLHKIKLTRGNTPDMYIVIFKYTFLKEHRIVSTQIKAFESAIVDIVIFYHAVHIALCCSQRPSSYQMKFKVNQDVLLLFDIDKQELEFEDFCDNHGDHESPYKTISWEPKNGRKEIAEGEQIDTTKFYAESNIEITLKLDMNEMCQGFVSFSFDAFSVNHEGKFKTNDLEIDIIEINGKLFKEAITSAERIPLAILSFQRLLGLA